MPGDPFCGKLKSAREAVAAVKSGSHVLVGSGASEPQELTHALAARGGELSDIEITHLMTLGTAPYAQPKFKSAFRHNALFIGRNVREAVCQGLADYTPCFLSEVPRLIRSGRLPVDVAFVQVTPPEGGVCSLGVSVDILKAAVETADYVVAQVNPRLPWTLGDSFLKVSDIDAFVLKEEPVLELPRPEPTAVATAIGRYVARLVDDGDTIQVGIGTLPDSILAALAEKRDLGVHSEMISDGILDLWRRGVLTGAKKSLHPGKIVTSFCMGTKALYDAVARNPAFEFYPSDYVNAPTVIAKNDRMVSINSALQVDLTGQVGADSIGHRFYSGVGGQVDFIRGAAASAGGRSIIALPSTAKDGKFSRIAPLLSTGGGVVTTRADIDFIVTEYGIASLKGKNIRQRAVSLIQIAHPDHRKALIQAAKELGYLDKDQILPFAAGPYREDLEAKRTFGEVEVFFRPLKPSDERRLKDLFYSQSLETTYRRYGMALKRLSERQFQELVAIDYDHSMAIAGFVREGPRQKMIAVGRYYALPGGKLAESAFTVHDDYQAMGIGGFLVDYLTWIARERGLEGFRAEVMAINGPMRRILRKCYRRAEERDLGPDGTMITTRFCDWKGKGNPALQAPNIAGPASAPVR